MTLGLPVYVSTPKERSRIDQLDPEDEDTEGKANTQILVVPS
jgi:hypothetical protein